MMYNDPPKDLASGYPSSSGGMTRRRVIVAAALGTAVLTFFQCSPRKYRFRVTVEIQTSQGIRSGSSIYEAKAARKPKYTSEEGSVVAGLAGQAVVVDLPDGPVFVLTKLPKNGGEVDGAAARALLGDDAYNKADYVTSIGSLSGEDAKAKLPRENWPMIVRFRDLHDPKSVEEVDPDAIGVKRIWVETTHDPVTTGIEKRFPPWFMDLYRKGALLDGNTSGVVFVSRKALLAADLSPGDFTTELDK